MELTHVWFQRTNASPQKDRFAPLVDSVSLLGCVVPQPGTGTLKAREAGWLLRPRPLHLKYSPLFVWEGCGVWVYSLYMYFY